MGTHSVQLMFAIALFVTAVLLPADARAQSSIDERLVQAMGLPSVRGNGVEIRVWLWSNLRVQPVYRIMKIGDVVSVEKLAWAKVERAFPGGYTEAEARRETRENRDLLRMQGCDGSIRESAEYLWCRTRLQRRDWSAVFDNLRLDELRTLPSQGDRDCDVIVLDGETVGIEIAESGRRRQVEYSPDVCCTTAACDIVRHVRAVVVQNIR